MITTAQYIHQSQRYKLTAERVQRLRKTLKTRLYMYVAMLIVGIGLMIMNGVVSGPWFSLSFLPTVLLSIHFIVGWRRDYANMKSIEATLVQIKEELKQLA